MEKENYQRCTKTIMDNIVDPDITFDKDGISNYWYDYKSITKEGLIHGQAGKDKWQTTINEIKKFGKKNKYDCIIGISGGVDSTYIAYLVKQAGLRPLVVHFDNGWNSEIAVQNINKIIEYLDCDLYTLVIDWEEFRDLQRSYLKAGVVDIEVLTDHAILGTLYSIAAKNNIKHVISGTNYETELLLPISWIYNKTDPINIKDIHSKYGNVKLRTYPFFDILKKKYYLNFKKLTFVMPINWAPYNKEKVKKIISKEIGWEDYGGKHHESVFTKFYQNYILPTKFHIDKRKSHLSCLICSGQLTREKALEELEKPLYDPKELITDKEYVIKKLGFTPSEFDELMQSPPKSHFDFKTEGPIEQHYPMFKPIKSIYKLLR